jgi:hypothetical protein
MGPLYEVVTGQVLLSQRSRFFELHGKVLLPIMKEHGIQPVLMLMTEIGRYGRFLDVYKFESMADYELRTDKLVSDSRMPSYYDEVGKCIHGSICVELMTDLPYSVDWIP